MTKPKAYHHGDLREALIKAAVMLLESEGPSGFTLRRCASLAGVSHSAPAHHFATAADLLAEVAARGFERFVASLGAAAEAAGGSPLPRLEAMGRAYIGFALANPAVYGLMFRHGAGPLASPHLKTAASTAWQQLCDGVALALEPDRQSEIPAKAAAIWSLVHGAATLTLDRKLPPQLAGAIDPIEAVLATLPGVLETRDHKQRSTKRANKAEA